MKILGMIFDFNGVLVDDEPLHFQAFKQTLERAGWTLNWEEYRESYLPYDDKNFFLNFLRDHGGSIEPKTINHLMKLKSQEYLDMVEKEPPMIEPSVCFVNQLPPEVFLAVASGAARTEIEVILGHVGLLKRFLTIVAAEDVINGKPHPEGFQKALSGLQTHLPGLKASQVVGIEDSYRGVPAVQAAGMKCIAVATTYPADRLCEADLVIDNFEGWTLERLETALGETES